MNWINYYINYISRKKKTNKNKYAKRNVSMKGKRPEVNVRKRHNENLLFIKL